MTKKHRFDPGIFREYDIRGEVGRSLSAADALAVGRAFGSALVERGGSRVCVGYDGRLSSPTLEGALVAGLAACGLEVCRIGLGPTPLLYFAVQHLRAAGGVMVTGSHNPPEHNGFKLVADGLGLTAAQLRDLAARSAAGRFHRGDGRVVEPVLAETYAQRLGEEWPPGGGRPLTVVWDPGHGAAGVILPLLLPGLPGRHRVINGPVDGRFPAHPPDPAEAANLRQLQDAVVAEDADLGVAFDGDGDRLGVVDERGRVVFPDQLLLIFAEDLLRRHPGAAVVADVKASQLLFDEVTRLGGRAVMGRSGRSLIQYRMGETGALLGGEMSGHLFFADRYYGFDDALYAAVRLLSLVAGWPEETLANRVDRLPHRLSTPELRLPCADTRKFRVVAEVQARLRAAGQPFDATDGARVTTAEGWWLLRASNTQAALTARCEALSPTGMVALRRQLSEQLRLSGLDSPWR